MKITKSQLKQIIKEELQIILEASAPQSAVQISAENHLSMQIARLIVDLKEMTGASDEDVIQMIADFQGVDPADAIKAANLAKKMMNPEESGRLDEVMDAESLKILLDVLQKMMQPGEIESMLAGAGALGGAAAYQIGKLRKGK